MKTAYRNSVDEAFASDKRWIARLLAILAIILIFTAGCKTHEKCPAYGKISGQVKTSSKS